MELKIPFRNLFVHVLVCTCVIQIKIPNLPKVLMSFVCLLIFHENISALLYEWCPIIIIILWYNVTQIGNKLGEILHCLDNKLFCLPLSLFLSPASSCISHFGHCLAATMVRMWARRKLSHTFWKGQWKCHLLYFVLLCWCPPLYCVFHFRINTTA